MTWPPAARTLAMLTLVLAANTTAGGRAGGDHRHPAWMVGTWAYLEGGRGLPSRGCADPNDQIIFRGNGTWVSQDIGDRGRWSVDGGTVSMVQRFAADGHGNGTIAPWRRIGPRLLRTTEPNDRSPMVKCGP